MPKSRRSPGPEGDVLDLSKSRFPSDGVHIVLRDRDQVYRTLEDRIQSDWAGPSREKALAFLRFISGSTDQQGQKMDVMNRRTFEDAPEYNEDLPWLRRFFDLLQRIADGQN